MPLRLMQPPARPTSRLHKLLRLIPLGLLALALWKLRPWEADFSRVRLLPLLLALVINFAFYLPVRTLRWRTTLKDPPGFVRLYCAQLEGIAVGGAIGFGAQDVVRASRMRGSMDRFPDDLGGTLAERLAEAFALTLLLAITAGLNMVPLWALLPALLCALGLVIVRRMGRWLAANLTGWPRLRQGVVAAAGALSVPTVLRVVAFSFVGWAIEVGILMLSFSGFGLKQGLGAAVLVVVGINVAITVPGPPAQVGTFEAGVAGVLLLRGVAAGPALAFALAYHVLMAVPVYLAGFLILLPRHVGTRGTNR